MAAIPTLADEDAKRPTRERECLVGERTRIVNRIKAALARLGVRGFKPTLRKALEHLDALRTPEGTALPPNTRAELHRDMARLQFVTEQIQQIEAARSDRLEQAGAKGPNAMVRLLAQVVGVGLETADMLVHEILSRNLRDRRAVARYAGLIGSPDESGRKRREKGLAKAGNARVRRGMIQLAWRFLLHQKESALAQWYRARTAEARGSTRKTLMVALARKLLIALWRMVTTGEAPHGVVLRPAGQGAYPKEMTPTAFGPRSLAVAGPNDDPRWRRAERKHGSQAAVENGPAASELRRRCVLLHHGLDPLDPPNTSMWRDGPRPVASSPWVVVH